MAEVTSSRLVIRSTSGVPMHSDATHGCRWLRDVRGPWPGHVQREHRIRRDARAWAQPKWILVLASLTQRQSAGLSSRKPRVRIPHEAPDRRQNLVSSAESERRPTKPEVARSSRARGATHHHSPIAQLGARLAVNQEVRGSKPRRGARHPSRTSLGVAQSGARVIRDHEAAGSRPATETSFRTCAWVWP